MKRIFKKLPLPIKAVYIISAMTLNVVGLVMWLSEFAGKVAIHIAVLDNPCLRELLINDEISSELQIKGQDSNE